jgi:hypothetical protein
LTTGELTNSTLTTQKSKNSFVSSSLRRRRS